MDLCTVTTISIPQTGCAIYNICASNDHTGIQSSLSQSSSRVSDSVWRCSSTSHSGRVQKSTGLRPLSHPHQDHHNSLAISKLFTLEGVNYLIGVGYFSWYLEVAKLATTTPQSIIVATCGEGSQNAAKRLLCCTIVLPRSHDVVSRPPNCSWETSSIRLSTDQGKAHFTMALSHWFPSLQSRVKRRQKRGFDHRLRAWEQPDLPDDTEVFVTTDGGPTTSRATKPANAP